MKAVQSLIVPTLLIALTQASFAREGGGAGSHGADVVAARKAQLTKDFKTLRDDTVDFVNRANLNDIQDSRIRDLLKQMISLGLTEDIRRSPYKLAKQCKDGAGVSHDAATAIAKLGTEICFDLGKMSAEAVQKGELIGLALHEHAHHFGAEDNPVSIGLIAEVARLSGFAYSGPSSRIVYQDDERKIGFYEDRSSKSVFWYLPRFKIEVLPTIRKDSLTGVEYVRLGITPFLPEKVRTDFFARYKDVAPTLRMIPSQRITFGFPDLEVEITVDAEKIETLGLTTPIELALTASEVATFRKFAAEPDGIPSEIRIAYASAPTERYYSVFGTCKGVFEALGSSSGVNSVGIDAIRAALRRTIPENGLSGSSAEMNQTANDLLGSTVRTCFAARGNGLFAATLSSKDRPAYAKSVTITSDVSTTILVTPVTSPNR